jgi:hypothetical protein
MDIGVVSGLGLLLTSLFMYHDACWHMFLLDIKKKEDNRVPISLAFLNIAKLYPKAIIPVYTVTSSV